MTNWSKGGFHIVRKKFQRGCVWRGQRFYIIRLCECYCLMDHFPDDESYLIENPHGKWYFDKIIGELPATATNLHALKVRGRQLETAFSRQK